jgi:hypothetical protein
MDLNKANFSRENFKCAWHLATDSALCGPFVPGTGVRSKFRAWHRSWHRSSGVVPAGVRSCESIMKLLYLAMKDIAKKLISKPRRPYELALVVNYQGLCLA